MTIKINITTKLINLTPHTINVLISNEGGLFVEIPPSGVVARISTKERIVGLINGQHPIFSTEFGDIEGLPDPTAGEIYIVSGLVASKAMRSDVISPAGMLRDEKGRVIGCKGFNAPCFQPIRDLDLSLRIIKKLNDNGIHTVSQLQACSAEDLEDLHRVGKKSIKEIKEILDGDNHG